MWKKTDSPAEMRVSVNDLSLGMYVSRLNEGQGAGAEGFLGILIDSREDIDRIKAQSAYVYIDLSKSDKYAFLRLPEDLDGSSVVAPKRNQRNAAELAAYQGWIACATRWFSGSVEGGFIYGEN